MGNIHILPDEIISKIAAGEVIERPASVLKELVENSLDAGASVIEVNARDAGKTFLRLVDNGMGIARDDLDVIFNRHATSKISGLDELYAIASLGFRGEALYSIAAVSDVTVASKIDGQDSGWELHVRAGKRLSLRPVAMRTGTAIEIRELFFNMPARKKFLKSDTAEFSRMIDLFIPYTLLYPAIRFVLNHNDRTVLDLSETADVKERISKALHVEMADLIEGKRDSSSMGHQSVWSWGYQYSSKPQRHAVYFRQWPACRKPRHQLSYERYLQGSLFCRGIPFILCLYSNASCTGRRQRPPYKTRG